MNMANEKPRGYIVVDNKTDAIDWDAELHKTREAAIDSLCGSYQMYVRTQEDAAASEGEKYYWQDHYDICEVHNAPTTTNEKSN